MQNTGDAARNRAAQAMPQDLPLVRQAGPFLRDPAMDGAFAFGLELILGAAVPPISKPTRKSAKTDRI